VWYVPPLSPISSRANAGQIGEVDGLPDVRSLRIPVRYLANLLTAGAEAPVIAALERMLAARAAAPAPEALRVALSGDDPSAVPRQLHYAAYVSQAAARELAAYRGGLDELDARLRVLQAQLDQARAQLALIDEQLTRTRIVAPFDAIVVKGDLSQSLGAPVERGNVLFEVAPLDAYRVIMKVDERDITRVAVGQGGTLALASMPHSPLSLEVDKITPVSVVEEGRNFFRVEAKVLGGVDKLRPGMEGVGKIHVERRKLGWIWTHKIWHWLRMWVWSWWP